MNRTYRSVIRFTLFTIVLAICFPSLAIGGDLEVVESFWTKRLESTVPGTPLLYRHIEADRTDATALFAVTLVNRSKQEITSVRGTLSLPNGIKHSASGTATPMVIHPGVVRFGETFTLLYSVDFDPAFDNKTYRCPLTIEYSPVTQSKTISEKLEVRFATTGRVRLEIVGTGGVTPGAVNRFRVKVTNRGTAKASDLRLSFPTAGLGAAQVAPSSAAIVGAREFDLSSVDALASTEVDVSIFVSPQAAGTLQGLQSIVHYVNAAGETEHMDCPISVVVSVMQDKPLWEFDDSLPRLKAKAGIASELPLTVINRSEEVLPEANVTVSCPVDSIKMIEKRSWKTPRLAPGEKSDYRLAVFASKEWMGRAVPITLTFQFEEHGLPRTHSVEHSVLIDGDIQIVLQNATVSLVGEIPNLTGSLLNEGTTSALFTSIEVADDGNVTQERNQSVYLGDLAENSPLPFSIPLRRDLKTQGKTQEVQLRVNYKNSLREDLSNQFTTTVQLPSYSAIDIPEVKPLDNKLLSPTTIGFGLGVFIGVGLGWLLFRRRKNTDLYQALQSFKQEGVTGSLEAFVPDSERTSHQ